MRALQLFLVGFCVLIRPGSTMQLIIGFAFSLVLLLFTSITRPFQRSGHDEFSLLCNFSLVMVLFFCLVLKMGVLSEEVEDSNLLSEELRASYIFDPAALSVLLICTLLASVIVASVLAAYQVYQSTRTAARAVVAEREASIARGRLTNPPMHNWELRQGNRYCAFLSHFKEEAGSDARYLSDLIHPRPLTCPPKQETSRPRADDATRLVLRPRLAHAAQTLRSSAADSMEYQQ